MLFTHIEDNFDIASNLFISTPSDQITLDIVEMVKSLRSGNLTSTDAILHKNFIGTLRNVKGSTSDGRDVDGHQNKSWKKLLIDKSKENGGSITDNSKCYGTTSPDPGVVCSHDDFRVGGHMTTKNDGTAIVVNGDKRCYLIPWCFWHNSTSRDNVEHKVNGKEVLELTGYSGRDMGSAITFQARLAVKKKTIVFLYKLGDEWRLSELENEIQIDSIKSELTSKALPFLIFKKEPIL